MDAPTPLACLSCGYDLTEIETPRCPECGTVFTDPDRAPMARLRPILDDGDAVSWKHIAGWALVVAVYAVGAKVMNVDGAFPAGIIAAVLLVFLCGGSFALGSITLLGCDRTKRLPAQRAWRSELWLLHFPWLVVAPLSLVFLGISFGLMAVGFDLQATLWASLAVLCAWILCSLATPFVFMRRVRQRLKATGADLRAIRLRLWLAALLVLGATMFMGFGGGLMARYGAARMAGFADPPPDGF